jgi:hypothetical protein
MNHTHAVAKAPHRLSLSGRLRISWPLLIGVAAFLLPVCIGWGLGDPDTYWHVAVGRWMLEHRAIPTHDPFSFTMHGAPWTPQEWLSELLLSLVYQLSGWSGLVFLGAVCFGSTIAYLQRFLLARMEPLHALQLTCLAALMMLPSLLARPHALVWPLTAVWVGGLIRSSETDRAPPWWLLAVMLLWANMHGSFIVGLGFAAVVGIDTVVNAKQGRWETAKHWTLFVVAAFGCAIVNPQGYRLLTFPFHLLGMKGALDLVDEWRPPNFEHFQVLALWIFGIIGLAFLGRVRLSLVRAALLVGLLFIALQHARNVALLGLISAFLLAQPIATEWRRRPLPGRNAEAIDRCFRALAARASLQMTSLALLLAAVVAITVLSTKRPQPPATMTPRNALDALLSRGTSGRIFNDYNFGGYLIFRGIPVFVDSRVDLYGDAFIVRMIKAVSLTPGSDLEGLLAQLRIDAILLGAQAPAVTLLDRLPQWEPVYRDKIAVAYVRRIHSQISRTKSSSPAANPSYPPPGASASLLHPNTASRFWK